MPESRPPPDLLEDLERADVDPARTLIHEARAVVLRRFGQTRDEHVLHSLRDALAALDAADTKLAGADVERVDG